MCSLFLLHGIVRKKREAPGSAPSAGCCRQLRLHALATSILGSSSESTSPIIQGLITGIGFIGGGAILKDRGSVHGTATAASIWNTGAVGAAVAFGRYEIALVLSVINFATLRLLTPLKRNVDQ